MALLKVTVFKPFYGLYHFCRDVVQRTGTASRNVGCVHDAGMRYLMQQTTRCSTQTRHSPAVGRSGTVPGDNPARGACHHR